MSLTKMPDVSYCVSQKLRFVYRKKRGKPNRPYSCTPTYNAAAVFPSRFNSESQIRRKVSEKVEDGDVHGAIRNRKVITPADNSIDWISGPKCNCHDDAVRAGIVSSSAARHDGFSPKHRRDLLAISTVGP
ncbi:hypothetical protein GJ496_006726 [Pomphorhynchus laevis]|nr:hypothetical protein GJ496_006726 [Pomphorhynchus laevis]